MYHSHQTLLSLFVSSSALFSCRRSLHNSLRVLGYDRHHSQFKIRRAKVKQRLYNEHSGLKSLVRPTFIGDSCEEADMTGYSSTGGDNSSTAIHDDVNYEQLTNSHHHHHKLTPEDENVFGIHPVSCALEARRRTFKAFLLRHSLFKKLSDTTKLRDDHPLTTANMLINIWLEVHKLGIPILPVHKNKLDKLSNFGVHQGMALVASPLQLETINPGAINYDKGGCNLWILVDQVFDPMNFGGLIRTAVYFGVSKILMSSNCSRLSPVVSKASSGAMEFVPIQHVGDIKELVLALQGLNWHVVGTTCNSKNSISLSQLTRKRDILVIVGNEGSGVDKEVLSLCSTLVTIPANEHCPPAVDSLNVSVATGVVLSHLQFVGSA